MASCHWNEIIVTDDFKINLLDATNANCKLIKIFRDVGLKQLINIATREYKNTSTLLDHLYTTHEDRISEIIVPVYGLSDHYPICFTHKFVRGKPSKNHHEKITYRNFKNFSKENFVNDVAGVPWKALDVYADADKNLECWNAMFMDVLHVNKHIPLVTRRVKNEQIPGWMNRDIIRQIYVRDKLKARAKHSALTRTM